MDNGASSYRRFRDNGDVTGFDEIVMEYSDGLMLYLTSIVGNIWIAEELTEETFFLIGTKKPKFKEKCSFKTWLYTIGRNITLNYIKKNAKKPTVPLENAPDAYIKKEQQIAVHRAMRKLQPEYQQVLWLIYFEGLSNKEAAKVMKKSLRSTESILYRAKKSLRSQLEMEGIDYETT